MMTLYDSFNMTLNEFGKTFGMKLFLEDGKCIFTVDGAIDVEIDYYEEAEMDDGYSERGYSRDMRPRYDDRSYGRGRYAKRDSMGRYSSDYRYSGGDMVEELRGLMHDAPDEETRQEMQRLIDKMSRR